MKWQLRAVALGLCMATLAPVAAIAQGKAGTADQAVTAACLQHFKQTHASRMHVNAVASDSGYGLCAVSDAYTGGQLLLKKAGASYRFVGGGGGAMAPYDLELLYHVPAAIAERLVDKLNAAYRAARGNR